MKNDVEVDAAIRNALKSMAVCGCSSCSSFDRCRNRLLSSGGGPSLRGVSVGREKPKSGLLAKLARIARLMFSRSHRHLVRRNLQSVDFLGSIVRRMCIALLVYCAHTLDVSAIVYCSWNGSGYDCSGSGEAIITTGGDGSGGSGETVIVTNIVGTCTNCVAMSPEYVRQWKNDASYQIQILKDGVSIVSNSAVDIIGILQPYTNSCRISRFRGDFAGGASNLAAATNFLHSVGAFPGESPENKAAELTQNLDMGNFGGSDSNLDRSRMSFYDGAAIMYNQFAQASAFPAINHAEIVVENSARLDGSLDFLNSMLDDLIDEQCTAQWDGGSGGSGGSTVVTNQSSGNWCTYDQGEAIKELLGDIKTWQETQVSYLRSISNSVSSIDSSIRSALFSRYTAIPRFTDWQDVYLDGQPTGWGYDPTNILQRIEMLVYGISGISTNSESEAFGEDTTPDPSSDIQNIGDSLERFTSDASSQGSQLQRFSSALQGFFNAFGGLDGEEVARGDIFIDESTIRLNDDEFTIPALTISDNSDVAGAASTAQHLVRLFFSVVYYLSGAILVFMFWRMFAAYALKFTRWAQELLSSLFAS